MHALPLPQGCELRTATTMPPSISPTPHFISPGPNPLSLCLPLRKVLNKLNFSVPDDVMRKIAQCVPGVVELVLIPLRQRLEEQQRHRKLGVGSLQVPPHSSFSHCSGG